MKNIEILNGNEELKREMFENYGDEFLNYEVEYDLLAKQISTGKKGVVEKLKDGNVLFTVPSEDLTEYIVATEEFNSDFCILNVGGII